MDIVLIQIRYLATQSTNSFIYLESFFDEFYNIIFNSFVVHPKCFYEIFYIQEALLVKLINLLM